MSTGRCVCVTGPADAVQGHGLARPRVRRSIGCIAASCLLLAGCSAKGELAPVAWWHQLQGGTIAQSRPPPPNVDQPFPALGPVPAKPTPIDPSARTKIASALVADRANAQYATSIAPLPVPQSPPSQSQSGQSQVGQGPLGQRPAAHSDDVMSASLPAANAPPAAPRAAPVAAVAAQPLAPPASAAPLPNDASAVAVPMPTVPAAPPAPPALPGVQAVTTPTPLPVAPPVVAPVAQFVPGKPLAIAFAAGGANVSTDAAAALRKLADSRKGAAVAVTGYGDAEDGEIALQSAAMGLAWERAQAVSRVLQSDGVPVAALRVTSEAAGRGAVAQLTQ